MNFLDSHLNHTRKVSSGVTVAIYDLRGSGYEGGKTAYGKTGKWFAKCMDHNFGQFFHSKHAAWTDSRDSANICMECARLAAKEGRKIEPEAEFLTSRPTVRQPEPVTDTKPEPTSDEHLMTLPRTPTNIAALGRRLMKQHGFGHLPVKMNGRLTRALGRAMYSWGPYDHDKQERTMVPKRIELATKGLPSLPWHEIKDTILHEIAHLMTPGDHHGAEWKKACVKVGAKPERLYRGENAPTSKYTATCSKCGKQFGVNRMTKRWKYNGVTHNLTHGGCGGNLSLRRNF